MTKLGAMVLYKLNGYDVTQIEMQRALGTGQGNHVAARDVYPAVVVRDGNSVNLQVLLDGPDSYWATSCAEGDAPGQWRAV